MVSVTIAWSYVKMSSCPSVPILRVEIPCLIPSRLRDRRWKVQTDVCFPLYFCPLICLVGLFHFLHHFNLHLHSSCNQNFTKSPVFCFLLFLPSTTCFLSIFTSFYICFSVFVSCLRGIRCLFLFVFQCLPFLPLSSCPSSFPGLNHRAW